jgi:hypothetical protein
VDAGPGVPRDGRAGLHRDGGALMAYRFTRATPDAAAYGHIAALDGLTRLTLVWYMQQPGTVNSFDRIVEHIGANITGAGSASGFTVYHQGTDASRIAASFRNNETTTFTSFDVSMAAASTWYAHWLVYDGSLAAASRLRLWSNGSSVAASSGLDASTSLGVNDQPLAIGSVSAGGTNWDGTIAGLAIFPGLAITDSTLISDHAARTGRLPDLASARPYYAQLDYYAELFDSLNFNKPSLTTTTTGSPTVVTHPYTVPRKILLGP